MLTRFSLALAATSALVSTAAFAQAPAATAPRPAALTVQVVPPVPAELAARTRPYMELRAASFAGWNVRDRSMLIRTRFGDVPQFHRVAGPLMDRRQITFELEPVAGSWSPTGDMLLVSKDRGGDEFLQAYRLDGGRLTLLTDGKSRNNLGAWSKDAKLVGYSSTRRNGADTDLYVMDPRDPKTDQLMAEVKGGGWSITAFAPGNGKALVLNNQQITNSDPYLLDLATRQLTPIGDHRRDIAYGAAEFASDGQLWILSDDGSDVQRLGRIDTASGRFSPVADGGRWDIDEFDISDDGRTIAYLTNEAGASRLHLLDVASGRARLVDSLPVGVASGLKWAPWGELGFTLSSAQGPADAWSLNPATSKLTRWTQSETGGLDFSRNPSARLIEVKSFDGERVSGFLYRPDAARFPGKRPVIVNIHGGPESQTRPDFLGRNNFLVNELGIAIFYPNVRGSSGFGKRFVSLDNGAFRREDAVKDIGAFLETLKADPAIDRDRMAVTGGSYGGYMCYASAIRYAADFKGALCDRAISNFVTFLENTQGYRRDLRRVEYGDERDPAQRAKLLEISPLRRIAEFKAPMFIVQGANDPRVPKSEADQVVAALKSRPGAATTWYMVADNEGHGYFKKENQDYLFWSTLQFWQQTLLK